MMNILILGSSLSGKAAKKLADKLNFQANIVSDDDAQFPNFEGVNLLVVSPGVSEKSKILTEAKRLNLEVISELEFGYRALNNKTKILSITGTNGKTTTTELTTYLLQKIGKSAVFAGNIGVPLSEISYDILSDNLSPDSIVVVEVSSFQLEYIRDYSSLGAVILNVQSDHLNRYNNRMELYRETKLNIFKNTPKSNHFLGLSNSEYQENNVKVIENTIYIYEQKFINFGELQIMGEHNLENVVASLELLTLVLSKAELFSGEFKQALKEFKTGKHRIEKIPYRDNILVINDSKSTNPASTVAAINSIKTINKKDILLILGGLDKGMDFSLLLEHLTNVKKCYLIGETKDKLFKLLSNSVSCSIFNSLEETVNQVKLDVKADEKILFSPACASMDMFKNYQERGELFIKYFK